MNISKGDMPEIVGVVPIIAVPFDSAGNVDYKSFLNTVLHLIKTECNGLVLFGIASEFHKLNDEERLKLACLFVGALKGTKVSSILSVTDHSLEKAVERARAYEEIGADALMMLPPFFLNPEQSAIFNHLRAVLKSVNIPVLIQYAPTETNVAIGAQIFADLGEKFPNALFKIECDPPIKFSQELLELKPDAVILNGMAGVHMMNMLKIGGKGVMPGCSFTEIYVKIYQLWCQDDYEAAKVLHSKLFAYINKWMSHCEYIIQIEKSILEKRGIINTSYCRQPSYALTSTDHKDIDEFLAEFREYLI